VQLCGHKIWKYQTTCLNSSFDASYLCFVKI
jgi:hypothetical protein